MGIVKYIKGKFGGKAGRRRQSYRGFNAAKATRLLNGWTTTAETPDSAIKGGLVALVARARDSYLNNPFARRFVGLCRDNIVGPVGVKMQARAMGNDGQPDTKANTAIEKAWKRWCRAETCDISQRKTWIGMQNQAITSAAVDGEILARGIVGNVAGEFQFSLQHLDPALLDPGYCAELSDGRYIRMSIEYDRYGRALAYHLKQYDTSNAGYVSNFNGRRYLPIPADQIIHAFTDDQVGQTRGYPWMSTVLDMLKMLDAYFEAAVTAARGGASKMGFITTDDGEYRGDGEDADGATISEFEPGLLETLARGEAFTAFDPRYPHEMFADFVKDCLRQIASGLNVSYTGISGNLEGVSFSSIRTGVLEEREHWKSLQNWFIENYCRPVYEMWLSNALLAGAIVVEGRRLRIDQEEKYLNVFWQGRRWPWVDPLKDIATHTKAVELGSGTVSKAIREQGEDPEEVFAERAWELPLLAATKPVDDNGGQE